LKIASTNYTNNHLDIALEKPNLELIKILLEQGANPKHPLVLGTIWEVAIYQHLTSPELLKLFLEHGGDPFLPSLSTVQCRRHLSPLLEMK